VAEFHAYNFEENQTYKNIVDNLIYIKFTNKQMVFEAMLLLLVGGTNGTKTQRYFLENDVLFLNTEKRNMGVFFLEKFLT
jgi:hypothetical protein